MGSLDGTTFRHITLLIKATGTLIDFSLSNIILHSNSIFFLLPGKRPTCFFPGAPGTPANRNENSGTDAINREEKLREFRLTGWIVSGHVFQCRLHTDQNWTFLHGRRKPLMTGWFATIRKRVFAVNYRPVKLGKKLDWYTVAVGNGCCW